MKCISIAQPWAWLIVNGIKCVENRSWFTHYTGPLVIHTGRRRDLMREAYKNPRLRRLLPDDQNDLSTSAIVGACDLKRIVKRHKCRRRFAEGPYCWELDHAVALRTPVPLPGRMMIYDLDLGELPRRVSEVVRSVRVASRQDQRSTA